jgi:flagellar assembly protein FliH
LSNVIRSGQFEPHEAKILGTKSVKSKREQEQQKESASAPALAHENHLHQLEQQKVIMLQELSELETKYEQLKKQLREEKEQAEQEMNAWWSEKQREAEIQAEELKNQAAQEGFQEGYNQGYVQVMEELEVNKKEMNEKVVQAYDEKEKIIQSAEPFLLSLSVEVARKMISRELKQHPEQLLHMVQHALKQVHEKEECLIQLAPEDYPNLLPYAEELEKMIHPNAELKLVPVPNFSKGGCMIHTSNGSYDVTIDSQLSEIKEHLLSYYQEKADE